MASGVASLPNPSNESCLNKFRLAPLPSSCPSKETLCMNLPFDLHALIGRQSTSFAVRVSVASHLMWDRSVMRKLCPFEQVVVDLTVRSRELSGYGSLEVGSPRNLSPTPLSPRAQSSPSPPP